MKSPASIHTSEPTSSPLVTRNQRDSRPGSYSDSLSRFSCGMASSDVHPDFGQINDVLQVEGPPEDHLDGQGGHQQSEVDHEPEAQRTELAEELPEHRPREDHGEDAHVEDHRHEPPELAPQEELRLAHAEHVHPDDLG